MWFLHQLQQSDGDIQDDDAAPATSTPAVDTDNQASSAAADKGQMRRRDDKASQINRAFFLRELQRTSD